VIAGVVGHQRYQFDVWGAAVEDAARVKDHGAAGGVHVSGAVWQRHGRTLTGEPIGDAGSAAGGELSVYRVEGAAS
jgi:class 3 adenylate cyclase